MQKEVMLLTGAGQIGMAIARNGIWNENCSRRQAD